MVRVIVVELVVVEKSFDNGKGSGSKSAVPFTDTLINLDKWVIRVLLGRKKINTYKGKNRTLDCDYVRYLVSIDKVPNLLLVDTPSLSLTAQASVSES